MKLFIVGFIGVFLFAFVTEAHGDKKALSQADYTSLNQYSGEWVRSNGKQNLCPDKLVFTAKKKGVVHMSMVRPSSTAEYDYKLGTVNTKSDKRTYKAVKGSHDAYTLVSTFNTSVVNGRLVSNHLWSGEGETWTSMGTKVIGMQGSKLVLDKAITAYGDPNHDKEQDIYKKDEVKRAQLFKHQGFELGSSVFHCEFKKADKVAKK